MIEITRKENCCGCAACVSICPKKCITMKADMEGFDYPNLNPVNCIHCDLCEKACPILNTSMSPKSSAKGYIAYSRNTDIRLSSSSGGIFTEIANKVIALGGVVFGAAFDEHYLVHHVMIDNIESLNLIKGSKYLQSRIENTYREAESLLKKNRLVLFVGTACQIAGLKGYLNKNYSNLVTVDILCHGVPSPKVWLKYVEEIRNNRKVQSISFRDKETGWKNYSISFRFDDNSSVKMKYWDNIYMRLFIENINLRPSCYFCRFKNIPRLSDITLGDCWGVEHHTPEMDDDKGTSIIIVNTEMGGKVLSAVTDNLEIKEAEIDLILPSWADARKSASPHRKRGQFFKEIDKVHSLNDFSKLLTPSIKSRIRNIVKRFVISD